MPQLINPFVELGKIRGRREGRQEGRQEGRREGSAFVAMRLVQKKFPSVAKRVAPLVQKLAEEEVASFVEAVLFMQKPADCLAWFKRDNG